MNILKEFIKKYFTHFTYFYQRLRYRIFIALALSISIATLDGFGLAMFLPLLQMVDGDAQATSEGMGGLSFLVDGLATVGIPLTMAAVLLIMLIFFVLKGLAKFAESYYNVIIQRFFIKKMRFDNVDALTNYSYQAFVTSDVGRLQNTLSGEVQRVNNAYRSYFQVIQAAVMVLVYVFLAFLSNPQFAVLVTIGGILSNLVYQQIYKRTKENSRMLVLGNSRFQSHLIQMIAFFKYFKATGLLKSYGKKIKNVAEDIEKVTKKMGWYNSILSATREPLVITVVIGVILIQTTLSGQTLSSIILSLLFFYRSLNFLMQLQTQWNNFLNVSGSLENMTDFMEELKKKRDRYGSEVLESLENGLSIQNLSFGYTKEAPILEGISLEIPKNQSVAFVGESGSGKTTLVNIIAGLLPVKKGMYQVDGIDSRNLDISKFQRKIGYITQEPVIFSDTIFNNVTFWAEPTEANLQRFWAALEKASITDFVKTLPLKEQALLGNNGVLVSGGQKQRFSIARELYKDVDILIMDEATSALDSETELAIQNNMDALKGQYTLLIVAHRLATIKNSDKVVILDKGKIEATGDFNSLKAESKLFDKMISLQEV